MPARNKSCGNSPNRLRSAYKLCDLGGAEGGAPREIAKPKVNVTEVTGENEIADATVNVTGEVDALRSRSWTSQLFARRNLQYGCHAQHKSWPSSF